MWILRAINIFEYKKSLLIKKQESHQNLFGFMVTISLFIFLLILGYQFGKDIIERTVPNVIQTQRIVQIPDNFTFTPQFPMAFGVQYYNNWTHFLDQQIYTVSFEILRTRKVPIPGGAGNTTEIITEGIFSPEICNPDIHFKNPQTKQFFDDLDYQNLYCFPHTEAGDLLYSGGNYDISEWHAVQVSFQQCNSTERKCKPDQFIKEALDPAYVVVYYPDIAVDQSKSFDSLSEYGTNVYSLSSTNIPQLIQFSLQPYSLEIDDGLVLGNKNPKLFKYGKNNFRENAVTFSDTTFIAVSLEIAQLRNQLSFSYMKVQDVLGNLNGIYEILMAMLAPIIIALVKMDHQKELINQILNLKPHFRINDDDEENMVLSLSASDKIQNSSASLAVKLPTPQDTQQIVIQSNNGLTSNGNRVIQEELQIPPQPKKKESDDSLYLNNENNTSKNYFLSSVYHHDNSQSTVKDADQTSLHHQNSINYQNDDSESQKEPSDGQFPEQVSEIQFNDSPRIDMQRNKIKPNMKLKPLQISQQQKSFPPLRNIKENDKSFNKIQQNYTYKETETILGDFQKIPSVMNSPIITIKKQNIFEQQGPLKVNKMIETTENQSYLNQETEIQVKTLRQNLESMEHEKNKGKSRFSIFQIISYNLPNITRKNNTKKKIYNTIIQYLESRLDVASLLHQINQIDMLKYLLLSKEQCHILDFLAELEVVQYHDSYLLNTFENQSFKKQGEKIDLQKLKECSTSLRIKGTDISLVETNSDGSFKSKGFTDFFEAYQEINQFNGFDLDQQRSEINNQIITMLDPDIKKNLEDFADNYNNYGKPPTPQISFTSFGRRMSMMPTKYTKPLFNGAFKDQPDISNKPSQYLGELEAPINLNSERKYNEVPQKPVRNFEIQKDD